MPKRGSSEFDVKTVGVSREVMDRDYKTWKAMSEVAAPMGLDLNDLKYLVAQGLNHENIGGPEILQRMLKIHEAMEKASPKDRARLEAYLDEEISARSKTHGNMRRRQREALNQEQEDQEIVAAYRRKVEESAAASRKDADDMMGMLES